MRLGIIGGRDFSNYDAVRHQLNLIRSRYSVSCIVSGGAKGADSLAERYANEYNIKTLIFKADWDKYGKTAGFIRNSDIVNNSDLIIAFWDGNSKGTLDSINKALKTKTNIVVLDYYGCINDEYTKIFNFGILEECRFF